MENTIYVGMIIYHIWQNAIQWKIPKVEQLSTNCMQPLAHVFPKIKLSKPTLTFAERDDILLVAGGSTAVQSWAKDASQAGVRMPGSAVLRQLTSELRHLRTVVITSPQAGLRSIAIRMSVHLLVSKTTCLYFTKFSVRYLLSWLSPPLMTVQYVMNFRFCGWCHFFA